MTRHLQRAVQTLILLWCEKSRQQCLSQVNLPVFWRGEKKQFPLEMNESNPGGLGSGSNWEALWKQNKTKNPEFYLNSSMFQILPSFTLTWKSFEDKLWYLCSGNKINRIKGRKTEQDKCMLSTMLKCDLRSLQERIILTSLAKLVLQVHLISDFFVKVTIFC